MGIYAIELEDNGDMISCSIEQAHDVKDFYKVVTQGVVLGFVFLKRDQHGDLNWYCTNAILLPHIAAIGEFIKITINEGS